MSYIFRETLTVQCRSGAEISVALGLFIIWV